MVDPTQPTLEELVSQRAELRRQLENLNSMADEGLPVADAQAQIKEKLAAIEKKLSDRKTKASSSPTFDQHGQGVDTQINVGGDYYAGQPARAALDEGTALIRYLDHIIESNQRLQLQGIRSAGQLVSIDLEQIYVTLTATETRSVESENAWLDSDRQLALGVADHMAHRSDAGPRETVAQVKVKVQEALAAHPRLVIIGDPGCGKTTLLRYLALTFARDLRGESGLVKERLDLTEQRLPVFLPLRGFSLYLEIHHPDSSLDGPKLLLNYLLAYFVNQDIAFPEQFFADRLQKGECVLLFDGVDEVADIDTRHRIARIIEQFTIAYGQNRFAVTSRVVGYTGSARLGEGYSVTKVRDFTKADIKQFLSYWNRAVEAALSGEDSPYVQQTAERQTEALLSAIDNSERVRELAVNPLLLTVIALVQRYRAQLPERRTELYEEAIEVLLGKWDEAKGLKAKTLMAGRELDAGDRRSMLEPVALWMMEQKVREIEAGDLQEQLKRQFLEMLGDPQHTDQAVGDFLRLIHERSGLLAERGQGIYSFSHLTFQEHLAARAVSDKEDYIPYTLDRLNDSWWREAILLEVGYLSTQGRRRGTALIKAIMNHKVEPEPYYNLVLAAECLRDVGLARVESDLWHEAQRRLREQFERPLRRPARWKKLLGRKPTASDAIRRRTAAAEALARIESGGSGTEPAFWRLPYGEPVWVEVPAGEFWMGSEKGFSEEKPVHSVFSETFYIARVLITNAQYQIFTQESGHPSPENWEDDRPPRDLESHPIVNVSWHDAMAYCRWLAKVTGKPIALPSEAQWEKAARGSADRREYPWGDEWDMSKCNNTELELGDTTPVGIFPEGVSPYGCLDMAGNVWEWTSSHFVDYPYDPADGRENVEAGNEVLRVLRGGSFDDDQNYARCAYRFRGYPSNRSMNYGFRVVVSPISGL